MQFDAFMTDIHQLLPSERIISDEFRRFAFSTDASFYRMLPRLVVLADNESEISALLLLAARYEVPMTFRAAGTSLSGQAVSDSVLVMLTDNWSGLRIEPLGELIHLQPGVIGAAANKALGVYGRKIGPDPASIQACKVGGIVANNASGMCCGTRHNSYHTLKGLRLILADGAVLDTRDSDSVAHFSATHRDLLAGIGQLRDQLLADDALVQRVRHKYRLKNTTGYGLNALLDYSDPIDILAHLMVGSEGTLGFIAEVSLATVEDYAHRASAMVAFANLQNCAEAVALLKTVNVDAVELLDARSLRAVQHMPGLPAFSHTLADKGGVLLIDVRGVDLATLQANISQVEAALAPVAVHANTGFSTDQHLIDGYWQIRKGTFPAVGAVRPVGTTVIIEDVAFPIDRLAEGVDRLQQLFDRFNYSEAIIFGHALEGNLHFVFTQAFDRPDEIARYRDFMAAVTQMVAIDLSGSLKAEHGTGRNMAPFVELEWGEDAFGLMKQIKTLLDPSTILNPGVIINDDPNAHIQHLKTLPPADEIIDSCIECGFCEPVCPSKNLSLTPRQRIAVYREMARKQRAQEPIPAEWDAQFQHLAVDTCAATGLCEVRCPVGINTGSLVLKIRAKNNQPYRWLAQGLARHYAALAGLTRSALWLASATQRVMGAARLEAWSGTVRGWTGQRTPLWLATTPGRAKPIYARNERVDPGASNTIVYWASCVSQSMGKSVTDDRQSIPTAVRSVLKKAQLHVVYPQPTRGLCCGQPFHAKGHVAIAERMMNEVLDALWEVSGGGRYPVLSDTSPCSLQLRDQARQRGIQLYDSSEFIDKFLLNRLHIDPVTDRVAVHVTCSAQKQGLENSVQRVVKRLAPNWMQPEGMACCGFAGDKGFTQPELNASALKTLAPQVSDCAFGVSTSRTCEIGLSKHSGLTYYSLFEVLDKQSKTFPELIAQA
jgi:D-lactate dehydrogenase